ncbi:Zn-dependent protease/CBS domain-containing protein [Halarchaeum rubridurum]|uniref:Zinc metalloprotease n=1 Tax=Halarchaeum rubridurum TaxID=489911 RepID=A0A830FLK8_9EURY|nr:site-2 protease family protein [Halarchaeum rubridurum]MBP1954616.1 Zn-dependent protease/CBS domain-containing protein [Halarchaeum rubridurum]GGM62500.1 metalloprotease [Halarchaeum rubridurum]
MRKFTVGRVWGIPIRIDLSLVLFLPLLAWLLGSEVQIDTYAGVVNAIAPRAYDVATLHAGANPWLVGVLAAVGLFVGVALHELGHAYAGARYGVETESITLWLLGGLASLSTIPRDPEQEFGIAIAGPVTSLLVAALCYAGLYVVPPSLPVVGFVVGWLAISNALLAGFNLLPAFPMDGGRVLRAYLARSRPYGVATRTAARIGVGFAVAFAIFGVLNFAPLFLLLAWFVYSAATGESRTVLIDDLLEGLTVRDVLADTPTIDAKASVQAFADRVLADRRTEYAVTENGRVVGVVTLDALRGVREVERDAYRVEEVMVRDLPSVAHDADAFEALAELNESNASAAFVVDGEERVGVVTRADYASVLQTRQAFDATVPA